MKDQRTMQEKRSGPEPTIGTSRRAKTKAANGDRATSRARAKRDKSRGSPPVDPTGRQVILEAAAELFASRGYAGTSIRDIAEAVSMKTASLYYHFPSKEDLFLEAHAAGIQIVTDAVRAAIAHIEDPWDQLEEAAATHAAFRLSRSARVRAIIVPEDSAELRKVRARMLEHRNAYEQIFRDIIGELELYGGVDRRILRLQILGSLNWMRFWHRSDGSISARAVAKAMINNLRQGIGPKLPRAYARTRS
jgi:TetR/AcrR family transcriptional regulator, cholesterol catabolism regulator